MSCDCAEWSDTPVPLQGWIPFNQPTEPLVLWDDEVSARADDGALLHFPARVTLTWRRRVHLEWAVDEGAVPRSIWRSWYRAFHEARSFTVDFGSRMSELDASLGTENGGALNGGVVGQPSAEFERVVVHWVGLPELHFGSQIHAHSGEGWRTWPGRSQVALHGWDLTLDARPDLGQVLREARELDACVITHVMEVRRTDGSTFGPEDAKTLLWGLQCALSFACGHWVCPAVPVGFASSGEPVWSEWRPGFADPAQHGLGWWDENRPHDLWAAVDHFLAQWFNLDLQKSLQYVTIWAVSAVHTGFVEQRLLTAIAALELLSWSIDIQERNLNEERWSHKSAYDRLRKLLTEARIPIQIDSQRTPALAAFATTQGFADGLRAVIDIRHSLTHPKNNAHLYAMNKTMAEAHLLSLRYLELALLHRLGYRGRAYDRTRRGRWSGESDIVPWARPKLKIRGK